MQEFKFGCSMALDPEAVNPSASEAFDLSGTRLFEDVSQALSQPVMNSIEECLKQSVLLVMHEQKLSFANAKDVVGRAISDIPDTRVFDYDDDSIDGPKHSLTGYSTRAVEDATDNGNFTVSQSKAFVLHALNEFPVRCLLNDWNLSVAQTACHRIKNLLGEGQTDLHVDTDQFGDIRIKEVSPGHFEIYLSGNYAPILCEYFSPDQQVQTSMITFKILADSDLLTVHGIPDEDTVQALERVLFAASK